MQPMTTMTALDFWQRITLRGLKEVRTDLSARQTGILLTIYLKDGPHTIKNLSETLGISKAAVCRALDTLGMEGLIKRKKDDKDKRNVFVQRTIQGSVFLSDFADIIMQEAAEKKAAEIAA